MSEHHPEHLGVESRLIGRFLVREERFTRLLLLATIVGALAGLVGGLFQRSLAWMAAMRTALEAATTDRPWVYGVALIGSSTLLTVAAVWLVRRFAPEAGGSGVQEIEGAMGGVRPMRWARVLAVKFIGGVMALGAGLVLGREGPTIQMGGAVGRAAFPIRLAPADMMPGPRWTDGEGG